MKNTYYSSTSEVVRDKVDGYTFTDNSLKQKQYIDHSWPHSAGSFCSTTENLSVWMRALHEGEIFIVHL